MPNDLSKFTYLWFNLNILIFYKYVQNLIQTHPFLTASYFQISFSIKTVFSELEFLVSVFGISLHLKFSKEIYSLSLLWMLFSISIQVVQFVLQYCCLVKISDELNGYAGLSWDLTPQIIQAPPEHREIARELVHSVNVQSRISLTAFLKDLTNNVKWRFLVFFSFLSTCINVLNFIWFILLNFIPSNYTPAYFTKPSVAIYHIIYVNGFITLLRSLVVLLVCFVTLPIRRGARYRRLNRFDSFAPQTESTSRRFLLQEDLDKLPTQIIKYKSEVEDTLKEKYMVLNELNEPCSICFQNFVSEEVVRNLPCKHFFHLECIDSWLSKSQVCPLCKLSCLISK